MRSALSTPLKLILASAIAGLVACGGGGDGGIPIAPPVAGGSSSGGASSGGSSGGSTSSGGTSSGGSSGGTVVDACSVEGQKQFALETALEEYLWYDEMASVNPDDFNSVNEFLLALTAPLAPDGRDPGFSFMTTIADDEAGFTSGAFVGFGFRSGFRNDRFFIADAFEGGAAFEGGFRRGLEVLAIDTQSGAGFETIAQLNARGATTLDFFGPSEAGVERGFRLTDGESTFEVTIAKREVDTPPLAGGASLIPREGNSPIGYFHLRQFTLQADDALSEAIGSFAEAGVTDVIIDLRYNPGGLLSVSANMLDLLGGQLANGQVSITISHNDKQAAKNRQATFIVREQSMRPLRIAFITTESSASASELVINSMAPHVELVLVGSDTSGKAVGQAAFDQPDCSNRLRLVTFEIVNGEGLGGYYTGLADTGRFTLCAAEDDVTRPFTDLEEDSVRVALNWLNTGSCPSAVVASGLQSKRAGELAPAWFPAEGLPDQWSPRWQ